ncbi:Cell division inhibitor protein [Halorhabdus tiamatea SARL4B]|uniref:Cell division inhibitor protein n=1 Tax=Halorhabdus tiamatea SARL4B TaxID=1033806 RepID=F7PHV1_9EURY|nr:MinD/ParA family protein [Halorhabdus tiamatea]ERJ06945.1 Cell division inhibitor protein [Halorhabdus tiamatea SARL4B]CCQ32354.1 cell division septum site-determining protein MinD [Halorhabdus tiamatea SARL4B]
MIVAVAGGKGGVGKSTVALNLARELEAVVVDGDLSSADLPRGTGPDLHDVLAGRVEPLDAIEQFWNMELLPCGRTIHGARAADLRTFETVLERLDRTSGPVVVDCPVGLARDVGTEIASADVVVLVTNTDEAALENADRTRELAVTLDTPVGAVVLNKTDRTTYERVRTEIETRFNAPVTYIPERVAIQQAQEDWVPVRDALPDEDSAERFEDLADRLRDCRSQIERRRVR